MGKQGTVTHTFDLSGNHISLDFVNTVDDRSTATPKEGLQCYEDLLAWGEQTQSITTAQASHLREMAERQSAAAAEVLKEAVTVREALFRIFIHLANEAIPSDEDLELFNRTLAHVMSKARIVPRADGFTWDWSGNEQEIESVLWPVVRASADLLTSEHLHDVRVCAADDCQWLFLDTSKNHSRRWCNMKTCGNRAKATRHNERRKQQG